LASAQTKADKAVAAKYDPIQEQITAATNNLNLILKSPDYSLADKNRAQAQLDVQKQKQDALDKAKQDTKDVNAVALEAAKNGADAVTLKNIMGAKDQASAIAAAGSTLKPADTTSVVDAGGRKLLIDSKTGATIKDLGSSATTSDIKAQKVQEDYKKAGQFLTDNPNASDAEIRNALLQNTSLTATDITALMATRYQAVNATTLADTDLQAIATGLIQQTSPEEALAAITAGRLNINGKEIVLSDEQKQKLTDEVNKQGNSPSSQKPWWQFW
jgi:hypothetical protein